MSARSAAPAAGQGPGAAGTAAGDPRRWLVLAVICTAYLMITLDITVMNLALPSAQEALDFSNADKQWILTAYALCFGSLLLFCGRLADLVGRKETFLIGLSGFALASAVGGAAQSFGMLVAARACQGAFAALLAPTALSMLATTFTDPKERGKAFGVFSAVAASGGGIGLLIGGALTSGLSWRWCMYVNLVFAAIALVGGLTLLTRQPRSGAKMDIPGVIVVSGGMFCVVYGFSNAATHSWHATSTWAVLAAGGVLLVIFSFWQFRAPHPLLPPRVVLDRNRGGAYLTGLIVGMGTFGVLLFLIYYMQTDLGYSAITSGVALLPMVAVTAVASNVGNIVIMPRFGPRPLVAERHAGQRGRDGLADADRARLRLRGGPPRPDRGQRLRHGPDLRGGAAYRHLRRRAPRRGYRLRDHQHRAAARRRDRHRAAQHDRGQRRHPLPEQPCTGQAEPGADPPRDDPRLQHRLLVVHRHLRRRRGHLRRAAAQRPAMAPAHGPGAAKPAVAAEKARS